MIMRQFLRFEPIAASYLFGCAGHAAAAVVDPIDEIALYLEAAEETGMRIRYVIDTHLHADHLSSGRALSAASGADYVLFTGLNRLGRAERSFDRADVLHQRLELFGLHRALLIGTGQ